MNRKHVVLGDNMVNKDSKAQKGKKGQKRHVTSSAEPEAKRKKTDSTEPEFSHVRFKFLLRNPETVITGLQKFLDISCEVDDDRDDGERLLLLESYLKSSPQCSEVLDLLSSKTTPKEVSLVFAWLRHVLQECSKVTEAFSELQQHLVKTLLTRHGQVLLNSLRKGGKQGHVKCTLMLLITIAGMGYKFAKLLQMHLDFTHASWLPLLSQRNRKDDTDVRACMTAFLVKLLQTEDEDLIRTLVEQRVLLQEVLLGLKYDQSEYVAACLKTIYMCIVQNQSIGKNPKMYLFNSPVLKELLTLYQWPGPKQWKRQPTPEEKSEYSKEQREVAEQLHPMLLDLLTNHKLGICFRDKSLGLSKENKNSAVSKVLQLLVTSYTTPLSHQLVTAILKACPDQLQFYLRLLQPHLAPRPVDTWVTCLQFFLKIVQNHEWPSVAMDDLEAVTEEKASQLVHFLFPPDSIVGTLKDGLKHVCATVRHLCLQALEVIATRGRHFHNISRNKLGDQAPLTLSIEGFVLKTLPNSQVLLNLLQKFSSKDSFAASITRDVYEDTDVPLPQVSRFQHLVAILRMYSLTPEHLTGGPADALALLMKLVSEVTSSAEELDSPPQGTPNHLPILCLLHALSECDVKKLALFGKGGNKGDLRQSLVYQLVMLMQAQNDDHNYTEMAHSLIVKLLSGTGVFEGNERELAIWLHQLENADSAPEEVVTFFVGLLRQYVPNPYPVLDRLLEQVEEAPPLIDDSYLPNVRLEFSPLVMLALTGDFYKDRKVHDYVCCVLIDVLHSLHNTCSFSGLVHSLSSNLDPGVTLYLTLHQTDEEASPESIVKRTRKKIRLKQLKSSGHGGILLMKKLMKGEGEVKTLVEKLSTRGCLSLVQQSLRYLDEMVAGCVKNEGELLNKKLGEICVKTLKAASLHLANCARTADSTASLKTSTVHNATEDNMETNDESCAGDSSDSESGNSKTKSKDKRKCHRRGKNSLSKDSDSSMVETSDEDEDSEGTEGGSVDTEAGTQIDKGLFNKEMEVVAPDRYCAPLCIDLGAGKSNMADLSQLRTDWLREILTCVLSHPLISQWLFLRGCKQGGTPREGITHHLYDVVKSLTQLKNPSFNMESVFDVIEKCRQLMQAASTESSDDSGVPESLQPLFCRCLETLLSVGEPSQRMECLLVLVRLPVKSFVCESSQTPSALAQSIFKIADSIQLDSRVVKELSSHQDFSSSFEKLFMLASELNSAELQSLILTCIQSAPDLGAACSVQAFRDLLNLLRSEMSPSLQSLVECLMIHNPKCRSACGKWLKKKRMDMKERTQDFAPIMLMYLCLMITVEDADPDDCGVSAIAVAVSQALDTQKLDVDHVDSTFLLVVCHLINFGVIELPSMQKVQTSIMSLATKGACLHAAHVQVLAAILRQQSLLACGLGLEASDLDGKWADFEKKAGQVLVGCLRYLMNDRMTVAGDDETAQKDLRKCMIQLCQDLLSVAVQPDVKSTILTFWPDLVNNCLKYHYKDVKYLALLRQLVQRVFAKEEQVKSESSAEEAIVDGDGKASTQKLPGEISSSEEDDSDGDDDDDDNIVNSSTRFSSTKAKSQSNPGRTVTAQHTSQTSRTIVAKCAKILGLTKASDVARKCVAVLDESVTRQGLHSSRAAIVSSWTGAGSLQSRTFFPWPSQEMLPTSRTALASASHGNLIIDLCERCVGHTAFLTILQGGEHEVVREELVSLLACLVRLEKKCCSALPLNALIAAYGATLSLTDQNLLYLMFACDLYGNKRLQPGLWGEKAVQQLQMRKQLGKSLMYEINLQQILELIDPDVMATSILHFPLTRTMEFQHSEHAVGVERMMSLNTCYDPRFLLQVLFHFLGPEQVVDVRNFIARNCLGFALAALSSHDLPTRQVAISILANVYSHVESIHGWSSKPVLLAFLKVIMNGMTKQSQKLPAIVTIFLAKAAEIFMKPGDDMHVPIFSFLMLKAAVDVNTVPEFYHFFNSPKPKRERSFVYDFSKERQWILQLLQEGLRETSDHRLFQRCFVYKLLMCHANSSLSDQQTRKETLKVLVKATSIATVAKDLINRHGLLPWLVSFIKDSLSDTVETTCLVCQLLHNLCYTTEFNRQRLWWLSLTRLSRQCQLHTPLLVCVRLLLEKFSHLEAQSVEMLLDVLQHPHLTPSAASALLPLAVMVTWHLGRLGGDADATNIATDLARSLGFTFPAVADSRAGRKDENHEKDASDKLEKLSQLRKQAWRFLSGCSSEDKPLFVMSRGAETELCVQEAVAQLRIGLCQP